MSDLPAQPVEIEYKRWRSQRYDYEVVVLGVTHSRGAHGVYTVIELQRKDNGRIRKWPAASFLKTFEPLGRKLKIKSSWERL